MASTSKTESAKASEPVKAAAAHVTEEGTRAVTQATDNVRDLAARGSRNARGAAEGAAELQRSVASSAVEAPTELGHAVAELLRQQVEHNVETMRALYDTVDWDQVMRAVDWRTVARVQTEFMHVSMIRAARLTQRYLEVSQSMMASSASAMQRQARQVA